MLAPLSVWCFPQDITTPWSQRFILTGACLGLCLDLKKGHNGWEMLGELMEEHQGKEQYALFFSTRLQVTKNFLTPKCCRGILLSAPYRDTAQLEGSPRAGPSLQPLPCLHTPPLWLLRRCL